MLKDIEALETRALDWASTSTPDAADSASTAKMQRVREEHSRGGILLATEDALKDYEQKFRRERDSRALADGMALEASLAVQAEQLTEAISKSERLKSPQEAMGRTNQEFLLASVLDELQTTSTRQLLSGLTRLELADVYQRATDEHDNPTVRLIEAAVTTNTLGTLNLKDDHEHDAIAIPRLRDAVAARRRGRVPAELLEAQTRLSRISTTFMDFTMRHLRNGRGIAARPQVA